LSGGPTTEWGSLPSILQAGTMAASAMRPTAEL
jgi:hypothetical protein